MSLAQVIPLERQPGISVISRTDGHAIHNYFDTCPESPDGKKIIYFLYEHAVPGFGNVIVANRDGSNMVKVGERTPGNAHDAARQMWIDDATIAYSSETKWETYIVNLNDNSQRTIPGELLCYSDVNKLGLTRGFTSPNGVSISTVFAMHLDAGELDTLFTANDVAEVHPAGAKIRDNKYAILKNPKWSPDARHVLIKLKAKDRTGDATFAKHLLVADADGKNIKYLTGKQANHLMWYDNNSVYGYMNNVDVIIYDIRDGASRYLWRNALGVHGSTNGNHSLFVTDEFDEPSEGRGAVILYNLKNKDYAVIAAMNMPPASNENRVHPHPVWSRDYKRIYFNSEDSGVRKLYAYILQDSLTSTMRRHHFNDVPGSFQLKNYPNPFNARTVIAFHLKERGEATLEIYNTFGQKIDTIYQKRPLPPGPHQVTVDAAAYPSGLYLYRLRTSTCDAVNKMLLLR